jgi:archaellum component FlaD/FlaE
MGLLDDILPGRNSDDTTTDGGNPADTDTETNANTETDTMSQEETTNPGDTSGADGDATLEPRLNDLETELDGATDRMRRIEDAQEQLSDDVGDLNDTVRQLLGVYDQLAADANPFAADAANGDGDGDSPFGVAGGHDTDESVLENGEPDEDTDTAETDDDAGDTDPETTDGVVTYEDLAGTATDTEREHEPDPHEEEPSAEVEYASADHDAVLEAGEPESTDGQRRERERRPERSHERPATDQTELGLDEAAVTGRETVTDAPVRTYAGEIIALEWLSALVNRAGPAHALRALGHYEDVGWIDAETREYLERVLSGPELDIHVDPDSPGDLTSEDHARSRRYIAQLREAEGHEL